MVKLLFVGKECLKDGKRETEGLKPTQKDGWEIIP